MEDIIARIDQIVEKYKSKNKLNSEDNKVAELSLKDLFSKEETRSTALKYMMKLPVEIACYAYFDMWNNIQEPDRDELINVCISCNEITSNPGNVRLIELVKLFIPKSVDVAMRMIKKLSDAATDFGTKRPNEIICKQVKAKLVVSKLIYSVSLEKFDLNARDVGSLCSLIFFSVIYGTDFKVKTDSELVLSCLLWLGNCNSKLYLNPRIRNIAEAEVRKWPEELQRLSCNLGLTSIVTIVQAEGDKQEILQNNGEEQKKISNASEASPDYMLVGKIPDQSPKQIQPENMAQKLNDENSNISKEPEEIRIYSLLDKIRQYISGSESQNKQLKITEGVLRSDLNIEKKKSMELKAQIQNLQDEFKSIQIVKELLEQKITKLENANTDLIKKLSEQSNKHEEENSSLIDMVDTRTSLAAQQVKNKLAMKLRTDYMDFQQIESDKMTEELGEILRMMFKNVFMILTNEGIKFN